MSEIRPSVFANPLVYTPAILTYFVTFIVTSVELSYARKLRSSTCDAGSCWNFLTIVWAVAITCSVVSLAHHIYRFFRWRKGRMGREWLVICITFTLVMYWLSVLVIGWSTSIPDGKKNHSVDLGGGLMTAAVYTYTPPVSGMFVWSVDFYHTVIGGQGGYDSGVTGPFVNAARTGMAATVLCTMSFAWSVLDMIFMTRASYKANLPPLHDAEMTTELRQEGRQRDKEEKVVGPAEETKIHTEAEKGAE